MSKKKIRSKKYRKKRRKKLFIWFGAFLGGLVLLIGLLAWGSRAEAVRVNNINVSGNEVITDDDVKAAVSGALSGSYAWVFPKDNSLLYSRSRVRKALMERFSRIQAVELSLQDFSTLSIEIEERSPDALWCTLEYEKRQSSQHQCFFLDKSGFRFGKAPQFSGDVFFRYYGGATSTDPLGTQYLSNSAFADIRQFINALESRLNMNPVAFEKQDDTTGRIVLKQAADNPDSFAGAILFDYNKSLRETFEDLKTVVEKDVFLEDIQSHERPLEYIDLRVSNKVYYRFKSEEDKEEAAGNSSTEDNSATTTAE